MVHTLFNKKKKGSFEYPHPYSEDSGGIFTPQERIAKPGLFLRKFVEGSSIRFHTEKDNPLVNRGGSTFCAAIVEKDESQNPKVTISNLGDSRAFMVFYNPQTQKYLLISLSEDMEPTTERFKTIVEHKGGEIGSYGVMRVDYELAVAGDLGYISLTNHLVKTNDEHSYDIAKIKQLAAESGISLDGFEPQGVMISSDSFMKIEGVKWAPSNVDCYDLKCETSYDREIDVQTITKESLIASQKSRYELKLEKGKNFGQAFFEHINLYTDRYGAPADDNTNVFIDFSELRAGEQKVAVIADGHGDKGEVSGRIIHRMTIATQDPNPIISVSNPKITLESEQQWQEDHPNLDEARRSFYTEIGIEEQNHTRRQQWSSQLVTETVAQRPRVEHSATSSIPRRRIITTTERNEDALDPRLAIVPGASRETLYYVKAQSNGQNPTLHLSAEEATERGFHIPQQNVGRKQPSSRPATASSRPTEPTIGPTTESSRPAGPARRRRITSKPQNYNKMIEINLSRPSRTIFSIKKQHGQDLKFFRWNDEERTRRTSKFDFSTTNENITRQPETYNELVGQAIKTAFDRSCASITTLTENQNSQEKQENQIASYCMLFIIMAVKNQGLGNAPDQDLREDINLSFNNQLDPSQVNIIMAASRRFSAIFQKSCAESKLYSGNQQGNVLQNGLPVALRTKRIDLTQLVPTLRTILPNATNITTEKLKERTEKMGTSITDLISPSTRPSQTRSSRLTTTTHHRY